MASRPPGGVHAVAGDDSGAVHNGVPRSQAPVTSDPMHSGTWERYMQLAPPGTGSAVLLVSEQLPLICSTTGTIGLYSGNPHVFGLSGTGRGAFTATTTHGRGKTVEPEGGTWAQTTQWPMCPPLMLQSSCGSQTCSRRSKERWSDVGSSSDDRMPLVMSGSLSPYWCRPTPPPTLCPHHSKFWRASVLPELGGASAMLILCPMFRRSESNG